MIEAITGAGFRDRALDGVRRLGCSTSRAYILIDISYTWADPRVRLA